MSSKNPNKAKTIIIEAVALVIIIVLVTLWLGGFFSSMTMDDAVAYATEYANDATAEDVTLITEKRDGLRKVFVVKFECEDHLHEVTIHARTGELLAYTGSGEELYVPVG